MCAKLGAHAMNKQFIPLYQLSMLKDKNNEESKYLETVLNALSDTINSMPKTYEQDGLGEDAVAYIHYFTGNCDWYITEKDIEDEQLQAYGYANIGNGYEAGYISIIELLASNVEIDLHFAPSKIKDLI